MWNLEDGIKMCSSVASPPYFETESLTKPGALCFGSVNELVSP